MTSHRKVPQSAAKNRPLGGSRKGSPRAVLVMVAAMLTGGFGL